MKKLYLFPMNRSTNPYVDNYRNSLLPYFDMSSTSNVINKNVRLDLLKKSFCQDVYCLNWVESIPAGYKGLFLFILSLISLIVIRLRKSTIIWMFHNIHPHSGENMYSGIIQRFLFKHSSVIISHSGQAAEFARERAHCDVVYICHPFSKIRTITSPVNNLENDVFIWGSILPYKGIPEFLEEVRNRNYKGRIHIIGGCNNDSLDNRIKSISSSLDNVKYENRKAEFSEIATEIKKSKFTLFPYNGKSVSSSGALIDTIMFGGNPIGPNVGAFKDINQEEVCIVYNDYDELFEILKGKSTIDSSKRELFISQNTWNEFGAKINKLVQNYEIDN